MKEFIKKIVIKIITLEAKLILFRYRPKIIAVSGTVGKTTTKDIIFTALSKNLNIRKNKKSLNSELGIPLTIIGTETGWNSLLLWVKIIFIGLLKIIYDKYPEWLVLEVGIDHPGDMKKIAKWLKPNIGVFTTYSDMPVHVEFFDDPEGVMNEQTDVLNYIKNDGFILLNADDKNVLKIKNKSHVKFITYSAFDSKADFCGSNYQINYDKNNHPEGLSFKISFRGNVFPINLKGVLGEQYIYPVLISMAIADNLGISMVDVVSNLSDFKPVPGRLRILKGINQSLILDDSYNASPVAVEKALNTLKEIKGMGRRIVILGDMLELGRYSVSEHKKIGEIIAMNKNNFQVLICVGIRAQDIAQKSIELGFDSKKVFVFDKSDEVAEFLPDLLEEEDIILIKGSQGIRMEKIVAKIIADKDRISNLLVRQEKSWK